MFGLVTPKRKFYHRCSQVGVRDPDLVLLITSDPIVPCSFAVSANTAQEIAIMTSTL